MSSVVVNDLNVFRASLGPPEADSELIVDANAVVALPVPLERLKPITWRHSQVLESLRGIKSLKFTRSNPPE
jgi:hypothetical protein